MTTSAYQGHGSRQTPQSQPIPGSKQVENNAGGFAFQVDDWTRLERFLILGTEGGTYYVGQYDHTKANMDVVRRCLDADAHRTVRTIVEVSEAGRAPKNTPAVAALALASAHAEGRKWALLALPNVCRTGTHFFEYLTLVQSHRGWGRSLRRAVGNWYVKQPVDRLAYGLLKYRQREGWTHRDALRKAHPAALGKTTSGNPYVGVSPDHAALFDWVVKGYPTGGDLTLGGPTEFPGPEPVIEAYVRLQRAESAAEAVKVIERYPDKVAWEFLRDEHKGDADVQGALVDARMPMTALIRNLANYTRTGALKPLSERTQKVAEQIVDPVALQRARVHPVSILMALKAYSAGTGQRGQTWEPIQALVDALDTAFYAAFKFVEPTGKRHLFALDVSGSMDQAVVGDPRRRRAGYSDDPSVMSCMEGAMAMAMVSDRVEPVTHTFGFDTGFVKLNVSSRNRLDANLRAIPRNYGGTDCALPMLHAARYGLEVDVFCVYTDNETWAGKVHPVQALRAYREKTGIPAKLVVVGMAATEFSIADPDDPGSLDVVGFDASAPSVIADFARG